MSKWIVLWRKRMKHIENRVYENRIYMDDIQGLLFSPFVMGGWL